MSKKQAAAYLAIIFGGLALLWGIMLVQKNQQDKAQAFGEPLFSHALPAGASLVTSEAKKDDAGVMTAALLLAFDAPAAKEDLLAFYGDTAYPPYHAGEATHLAVKPLDDASLDALRQAGLYAEGKTYWFVYLTSR